MKNEFPIADMSHRLQAPLKFSCFLLRKLRGRALTPLRNNRGVALVFMVLMFTAVVTAGVMFISLGVKVKDINKEGKTRQRLNAVRTALQQTYLITCDLPDPSLTTPPNSVPTALLHLPQRYRYDSHGQLIYYDRLPASGHMTSVRNVTVHGNSVAAVLVAPGPNGQIDQGNAPASYDTGTSDDIVVAVSLEAEALRIANHTVAALQQAAKAYDNVFYAKNDDLDTLYYPPETRWQDDTPPVRQQYIYTDVGQGNGDYILDNTVDPPVYVAPDETIGDHTRQSDGTWYPNYAGEERYTILADGRFNPTGVNVPDDDESVQPYNYNDPSSPNDGYFPRRPEAIIDEDGYVPAEGGAGSGCVRLADVANKKILTNDPDRGVATLDACLNPAKDLAHVYGLNLIKLGYDPVSDALIDPWGHPYHWGSANDYGGLDASNQANDPTRNPHYWSFFSAGPDGVVNTADDILPATDRIPGYYRTPPIDNVNEAVIHYH